MDLEELSEEDLAVKEKLELYVKQIQEAENPDDQKLVLEKMHRELRTAMNPTMPPVTRVVTKPLKFLRPHYTILKDCYQERLQDVRLKEILADILSVWVMYSSDAGDEDRECLKFVLLGSKEEGVTPWTDEYMFHLAAQIKEEHSERCRIKQQENAGIDKDLSELVVQIVDYYMMNCFETAAVDLLLDTEVELETLYEFTRRKKGAHKRTCLYLKAAAKFLHSRKTSWIMRFLYNTHMDFEEYAHALQVALFSGNQAYVQKIFTSCKDLIQKKQLCYILARHRTYFVIDDSMVYGDDDKKDLQQIIDNYNLSQMYLAFGHELQVTEPKSPEDLYMGSSGEAEASGGVDSPRQILASTFVNAFLNAGFGKNNLVKGPEEWVLMNSEHGKISATASLGMITLWDVAGFSQFDSYIQSDDPNVVAGTLLGIGIQHSSIKHNLDPVLALLIDHVDKEDPTIRIGAIMGLGIAYANTQNKQIRNKLMWVLTEEKTSFDVLAFTCLTLGLVFIGSPDKYATEAVFHAFNGLKREAQKLKEGQPHLRLISLGYGLMFLGKKKAGEKMTGESKEFINKNIKNQCLVSLLSCAYAGTGNVDMVTFLFKYCDEEEAVLGIAMVAMAEKLGLEKAIHLLEDRLQYGEQNIRKTVPLALALLCISNSHGESIIDTLSRLSHDSNEEVAMSGIISLGLVGSGTNNGRIAGMLHKLSSDYCNNDSMLFCVRIAQGLVNLGRGLLTLNPFHSEGVLLSPVAFGGLLAFLRSCLNMKEMILGKYHYVMYFLVLAMQPRMLVTVDENLKPLPVQVQVGQSVGKPGEFETITGCQTLETPVVLSPGERAELVTDKYVPLSPILEGFVILKINPYKRCCCCGCLCPCCQSCH